MGLDLLAMAHGVCEGVFSSFCILRFCVFAKESSTFEILNVD